MWTWTVRRVKFLGERPWSREYYAKVINALFEYGGVKAVGLDFVFSPAGVKSAMLDKKIVHDNDDILREVDGEISRGDHCHGLQ